MTIKYFCNTCQQETDWYTKTKNGVVTAKQCKPCHKKYAIKNAPKLSANRKEYYENNKEHLLDYQKKYREDNPEKIAGYKANWQIENAPRLKIKSAEYYAAHKEEMNSASKARYYANREDSILNSAAWVKNNPERAAETYRRWKEKNKERDAPKRLAYRKANTEKMKLWRTENSAHIKDYMQNWRLENSDKCTATAAERRAQKILATPTWMDRKAVLSFYTASKNTTRESGVKHEVDHMVPLMSPYVCGLHTEANLDVLTKSANSEKGNRWWPDMWEITPETPRYEKPKENHPSSPKPAKLPHKLED